MTPGDKDRDIMGFGRDRNGENHEDLEIDSDGAPLEDDSPYITETTDIEQELERQMAADAGNNIGDDGLDFDFTANKKKSSGVMKYAAPAIVILLAAGAGAYILMNPQLLGGAQKIPQSQMAASDISENLPQPTATQNEAPAQPAPAAAPEDTAGLTPLPPPDAVPLPADAQIPTPPPEQEQAAAAPSGMPAEPPALSEPEPPMTNTGVGEMAGNVEKAQPEAVVPPVAPMDAAPAAGSSAPPVEAVAAPEPDIQIKVEEPASGMKAPEPVAEEKVVQPDVKDLKPVSAPAGAVPPISPTQGALAAGGTAAGTPAEKAGVSSPGAVSKDTDTYYDSEIEVPSGQMAPAVGPRKMDPTLEPGQKLVVVEGVRRSSDEESMIIAAGRALKLERYEAALEMYNGLYAKNRRDPRILMGRAVAQQSLGQDDAAVASYEQLLDLDPNNADAMANMMGILKTKNPASALQKMISMQSRHPTHAGLAAQTGITEGEIGNYQEAMRYLGIAASLEPGNPQHPFNMAVLADRQGKADAAIRLYEQALQVESVNQGNGLGIPRESIYDRLAVLRRR